MRNVIVHYHIFENAGSSIDVCLAESFGDGWHNFDAHEQWTNITSKDLSEHLAKNPRLRAMSSHQARWPEPTGEDLRVHPIVFLRDPIDRIGSMYSFAARRGDLGADETTLARYVDRLLEPQGGIVGRSFQTLFLSDDDQLTQHPDGPNTQASTEHFNQAVSRLDRLLGFGMVERFEESIALFVRQLTPFFPDLTFVSRRENVSAGRDPTLKGRIDHMRSALGRRRYRRLLAANEADMELLILARRMFDERVGNPTPSHGRGQTTLHTSA